MERENTSASIEFRIGGRIFRLPLEIIEEILSRLPVKSLLKFRCVSKSWRSLIDSECFIKIQLKNSTSIFLILSPIISRRLPEQCSWQSLFSEPVINSIAFGNLNLNHFNWYLVGCCHGLVCIIVENTSFYLWNPSTRVSKKLPHNSLCGDKNMESYGFGYDESCNDYKVLYNFEDDISMMYSLRSNTWKTLISDWDSRPYNGGFGKYFCGHLHWILEENDVDWYIVSFDLKNEVYGFVEVPSCLEGAIIKTLGVIEGCLSVVCEYEDTIEEIHVWVMRKYKVKESWVKVATLPNTHVPEEGRLLSPLGWGPNGEILMVYMSVFRFHNSEDDGNPRSVFINSVGEAEVYVESLVSLASNDEQPDQ